jgi:hypothetical protein
LGEPSSEGFVRSQFWRRHSQNVGVIVELHSSERWEFT